MVSASGDRGRGRALLALLLASGCALALAGTRHGLSTAAGIPPAIAPLVVAAQWLLWLLGAYVVALGGGAAALAAFGRPGRARVLLRLLPALVRPATAAALGVVLTAGPAVAAGPPGPGPAAGQLATDPFDWAAPADAAARFDPRVEPPAGPHGNEARPAERQPVGRRAPPAPTPTLGATPAPGASRPVPHGAARTVRVRAGDCLWSLAARDLASRDLAGRGGVRRSGPRPAEIAVAWRRWYAANRATIGPNPGLLHPGEVLRVPRPDSPPHPSNRTIRRPS